MWIDDQLELSPGTRAAAEAAGVLTLSPHPGEGLTAADMAALAEIARG
ncbi:hypothetical protein [Gulosibacter molinativorax]|nr:hypothetical protein [Gulosibacter molinativorax]